VKELPATGIRYGKNSSETLRQLALQIPRILFSMVRDARSARRWAKEENADTLISDGRYGFRYSHVTSFFISHQLALPIPSGWPFPTFFTHLLTRLNRMALRSFTEIWVPDFKESPNLSGSLGHPPQWPGLRYIGPLSRFSSQLEEGEISNEGKSKDEKPSFINSITSEESDHSLEILALCSGPEPQRTLFENALKVYLESQPGTRILLRGLPAAQREGKKFPVVGSLNLYDHAEQEDLIPWMQSAKKVIARSGYTTVMELACLGKEDVLLIPTPGQPEQEYLAVYLQSLGVCESLNQDELIPDMDNPEISSSQKNRGFQIFKVSPSINSSLAQNGVLANHPFFRKDDA
jgi:hypothetical protein